ncbi:MAG: Mu transposase C-terminal domain-containing protein [Rhizobiaceae bacterium]|nr:Mu transposase C-terminal domain-containing protein [Rhizobiaceae bacterium]
MREFYTMNDLLALGHPSLPSSYRGLNAFADRNDWRKDPRRFRIEPGRGDAGGTFAYHISLFPADVRSALTAQTAKPTARPEVLSEAWIAYDSLPEKAKAEAESRLKAVDRVEFLQRSTVLEAALALVSSEIGVSASTLRGWLRAVKFVAKADRLPALAPRYKGRTATADCDPRAWDFIVADYLRPEEPCFSACFGRLQDAAKLNRWSPVPSAKTLQRRIEKEIPRGARMLARKGRSEAQRLFPHQTRDRSVFAPMEAITADGHKFDVFVRMPDGEIGRPVLLAIQDLYSGMIVGWRLGETECWPLVRLAFLDMMEGFGIPELAFLDNGRSFTSKWLTGGVVNRYRFKVKEGEQQGLLTAVGIDVHWSTPYHGQAKPIERAFRDMCEEIAKHPRCAGAYTGNNPNAKPDNYGSRAVAWEDFEALVASEIARHNAKPGRAAANCRGRSFAETYRVAAETAIIRRAGREQLRLFMLASDFIKCREPSGEVQLGGNRYWSEPLVELAGKRVVARFDPQDLHAGIAIYSVDGRFLAEAACIEATGFNDAEAARRHAADKRRLMKSYAAMLDMERRLTIEQVAELMPQPAAPETEPVRPAAVRLVASGGSRPVIEDWSSDFSRAIDLIDRGVIPFPGRD